MKKKFFTFLEEKKPFSSSSLFLSPIPLSSPLSSPLTTMELASPCSSEELTGGVATNSVRLAVEQVKEEENREI